MNIQNINIALEECGWFFQENFLENELCDLLCNTYIDQANPHFFIDAKIGKGFNKSKDKSIRKSSIRWISNWDENESLKELNNVFNEMMKGVSDYFRLPLKRFESQVAVYNRGGFYRTHLDQHPKTRHRQLTCCLYLNDCEDGGELVLYKKGSKTEIEKIVRPLKGTLVLFKSADIFHEVKLVQNIRYSVTTWFRDDEILPFI